MSDLYDHNAPSRAPGAEEAFDRLTKWLVGDRLACVLLLGDSPLAFRLSRQGHEVVVAGDDVRVARDPHAFYVRQRGPRLPFAADAFDAVVAPRLQDDPSVLSEYARVLRRGGVLSSLSRSHDESIPWVRRLRELVGRRDTSSDEPVETLGGTGLFGELETTDMASWEDLDLPALLQYARETGCPPVEDASLARVRALFEENTAQTGSLRLRHLTQAQRATVDKTSAPSASPPPDTSLIDLQ